MNMSQRNMIQEDNIPDDITEEIIRRVRHLGPDRQAELLELLQNWQAGQQREYLRRDIKIRVDIATGQLLVQTDSRNISAGGIHVQSSGRFQAGDTVTLVFSLSESEKPFKLSGTVLRVEDEGIAIEFNHVTPYFRNILASAIVDLETP